MSRFEKVWKAFEDNEISHSAAHYLLAIESFIELGLEPRSADLARSLRVSRTAVSLQIQNLIKNGLLELSPGKRLKLTEEGAGLVSRIISKREIVSSVFSEVLGVSPEVAEQDGCKVEHLLSDESARALQLLQDFLKSGNPKTKAFKEEFAKFSSKKKAAMKLPRDRKTPGAFLLDPPVRLPKKNRSHSHGD